MYPIDWKLLIAFEAAARHGNFTRAAEELNVQQPAISRRVALLETRLGVQLLRRNRPKAALTEEGELLYTAIVGGTRQISEALAKVQSRPDSNIVTVNTTIGFASCYLMQRLSGFRAATPDVAIELVSRDQNNTYGAEQADVVIVFEGPAHLPGVRQALIFPETLVAVAHPAVAATIADDLTVFAHEPLLHLSKGLHDDDWTTYLAGTPVQPPAPKSDRRFTSFMIYLQAALNGEGIILGWERLLQGHLDTGQLVRVTSRRVETERGYFACLTSRGKEKAAAQSFWEWLATLESKHSG